MISSQPPQQSQEAYVSPFSARYAGQAMQAVFSPLNRARHFRRLWLILAKAQGELGLDITQEQLDQMAAQLEDIDLLRVNAHEQRLRHDVMAHVSAFAEDAPLAAPIIHLGATSCYVTDNADVWILQQAFLLLQQRLLGVARKLADFALLHKDLPALGYTHFQPAQPTTLGKRACLWLQDILSDVLQVQRFLSDLRPLGCKGATGTQASFLALFEGDQDKVLALDALVAHKMGFGKPVAVSGQTYSRKTDYQALSILSGIAQSASKFAGDLRLLQHLKEVEEPFEASQIGSSAMPYKRNPMRAERMNALSRFIITNSQNAAHTAASQWLERSLDDSANRRLSLAEGFLATDGLLALYDNIAGGLVVYPRMMEKHLMEELPFMMLENILMQAVKQGGNRQELHEKLRLHAMAAGRVVKEEGKQNDLLARVAGDKAFDLDEASLRALMNPADYTGLAGQQVQDYLNGEAGDILAQFAHVASEEARILL